MALTRVQAASTKVYQTGRFFTPGLRTQTMLKARYNGLKVEALAMGSNAANFNAR